MFVTFAGSPDRVEARLVPDAGYELDTFRISGFPRQPTPALLRALLRAGVAPLACRAILRRRRPDVVFGAGGYVAGPMVLAAATMRIPAALSEADAHLGLANRLALPFAKRVFLAYPLDGLDGGEVPRRRPADPGAGAARCRRTRRARSSSCRRTGRCCSSPARSPGARSLNELVVESFAERRPGDPAHHRASATSTRVQRRVAARRLPGDPRDRAHRRRATRRPTSSSRAPGSSVLELAAAGKPAILVPYPFATGDHQAKNAEHFVRAGGAIMVRDLDLDDVPDHVRSLLDDPARLAADERGDAARRPAGRGRRDRRGADRACDRLRADGSGSSASAARGCRRTRSSPRAWGAEVGGWDRVRHAVPRRRSATSRVEIAPEPVVPEGWEVVVSSAYPGVPGRSRAEFLAELVALRRVDRRRGHARQGRRRRR